MTNNLEALFKRPAEGIMIRLWFDAENLTWREWRRGYYTSPKGRIMFSPIGLFDGMNPKRIGQFQYMPPFTAEMVTTVERYDKDKVVFLKQSLRMVRRLAKRALKERQR